MCRMNVIYEASKCVLQLSGLSIQLIMFQSKYMLIYNMWVTKLNIIFTILSKTVFNQIFYLQ